MSTNPSTPVKVPPSAANHSAATLDSDLRSQINTVLLKDGHVQKIQDALLHALHSNPTNWPTLVQNHALNVLRAGDVTTFPALFARVLDDVRADTLSRAEKAANGAGAGSSATDKKAAAAAAAAAAANGTDVKPNLAIPSAVVEEMLKKVRDALEAVCEIDGPDGN